MMPPLRLYVVYFDPLDYPGKYVVRAFDVTDRVTPLPDPFVCESLEEARASLNPMPLTNIGHDPADDPKIVEVWI